MIAYVIKKISAKYGGWSTRTETNNKMKNKNYHTVETVQKYHTVETVQKYHTVETVQKSSRKIVETDKMDTLTYQWSPTFLWAWYRHFNKKLSILK